MLGILSLGSVFAVSLVAGVATIVALLVIVVIAIDAMRKNNVPMPGLVLIWVSAAWALLNGAVTFYWHWLAFTPTIWVLDALFVVALAAGIWKKLSGWAKALAALFAASVAVAAYVVPRPPGGEGAFDTTEKWKIDVQVTDGADQTPIEGASVLCGTVMQWQASLAIDNAAARISDRNGATGTWEFEDDPRLKIAICSVWKDANDGNAGYPVESQIVPVLQGGGEYKLTFALAENEHPDTAFLGLDLSGNYEHEWYYLTFEVWDGQPSVPFGDQTGPQPIVRKEWRDLRSAGFVLRSVDAGRNLALRYHYEGPSGPELGPPYNEVESLYVGPIPTGTRRRVALTIPSRQR